MSRVELKLKEKEHKVEFPSPIVELWIGEQLICNLIGNV